MKQTFFILLSTVFVNNVVLTQFLGLCPLFGTSRKIETALGMGLATTFVLTLAALCSYGVNHYLLIPFGLDYLRTISFIVVIACVVQLTELLIHKISPLLYQVLGLYLPLITSNCAVLGVALLNAQTQNNLLQSGLYGFGTAVGFTLVLLLFAGLRERLEGAAVPQPFQGNAIALITAGLMSLAFMGFAGMVRA
jgi:electron transport complex protein RnfA